LKKRIGISVPGEHTTVQPLALYTDPEHHNTQGYRWTDGRTDRQRDRQTASCY